MERSIRQEQVVRQLPPANPASAVEMPLMALVVGVMSAVAAEAAKSAESEQEKEHLAEMAAMLPPPCPEVEPQQVLRIQLAALKINDLPVKNHGVAIAHLFCTPESRETFGPPEQFATLFKDPMYAPLLNFEHVEFEPIYVMDDRASQRFCVTDAKGDKAHYLARLLIQKTGPEAGCWLTDSILRVACQTV